MRHQAIQVRDVLRVDLDRSGSDRSRPPPSADQLFNARIDVRAVEGRNARLDESIHVGERGRGIDRTVTARQLPAALDHAGDVVAGCQRCSCHRFSRGSGTTVTSEWRKDRRAVRVMRNRPPQLGSGQAMSVSVVIQSCGCVSRCFAGNNGSSAASAYIENVGRAGEHQVLAVHVEGMADTMAADHRPLACDHVHAQVVQLKHVVRRSIGRRHIARTIRLRANRSDPARNADRQRRRC